MRKVLLLTQASESDFFSQVAELLGDKQFGRFYEKFDFDLVKLCNLVSE